MNYCIKNECLTVCISSMGGEMQSIKDVNNQEYLWQGDTAYWGDRAPNLFPYIARLTDGKYLFEGKEYHLDIHGFAKDTDMVVEQIDDSSLSMIIEDTSDTHGQYPFHFKFSILYQLKKTAVVISYKIENKDNKTMYFGVGGHPGFKVPFGDDGGFEDYSLEFETECKAQRVGMSEDCFVTEKDTLYPLIDNKFIPLKHNLFDDDAIILKDMSKKVSLKHNVNHKKIVVEYPDMEYLGIWHMPRTDAPYVCIEPWTSLPSRKGIVEKLEEQKDLIQLEAEQEYINTWSITLEIEE